MIFHPLHSSSKGNVTRFQSKSGDADILVDVGTSWKKVTDKVGKDYKPDAIFVTHDHSDHLKGVGIAARKTGAPIYILERCYAFTVEKKPDFFKDCQVHFFEAGDTLKFGSLSLDTFSVRHDSADVVNFTIHDSASDIKLAFITDTGIITKLIEISVEGCDVYCIEFDYDTVKLAEHEGYDPALKSRISSHWGHMSNQDSIKFIKKNLDLNRIKLIMPLHLSDNTNSPELVRSQLIDEFGEEHMDKFVIAPTDNEIKLYE
jgi:phosphoribosyl 1,2-cyclic phosphodiesterase